MSYAGSFNSFSFGDGARPGASVKSISGWRRQQADITALVGSTRNSPVPPKFPPLPIVLVLNLHGVTSGGLSDLMDRALAAFTPSATPMPLIIGDRCRWVQVTDAAPVLDPEWAADEVSTEITITMTAADPVLYSATQENAALWSDPVTSATFRVGNAGVLVPQSIRHLNVRMTATAPLTGPYFRMDHTDGSYERISFPALTMTAGQVLRIDDDLIPRVGTRIVSGLLRSVTELGVTSRAARWWQLHPCDLTDGDDDGNEMTVGTTSGTAFTGSVKVRSTHV